MPDDSAAPSPDIPSRVGELDHFVSQTVKGKKVIFAGRHLLLEFWGCTNLDKIKLVRRALKKAAEKAGATFLSSRLHRFEPSGGVSGVVVLAESHISIHTWPERGYAALDIFMCGNAKPHKAIPILKEAFKPTEIETMTRRRGRIRNRT